MAENLSKKPKKSILKASSSFDHAESSKQTTAKGTKFDEMNIIATLHPADKDYGHMKVEEPKTPYHYGEDDGSVDLTDGIDANALVQKLNSECDKPMKVLKETSSEDEEEEEETPEEKAKRIQFESKRKRHYDEYSSIKLARQLINTDDDDDEESERPEENSAGGSRTTIEGTRNTESEIEQKDNDDMCTNDDNKNGEGD